MYAVPAGFSDDEFEDDEDLFFTERDRKSCGRNSQKTAIIKKTEAFNQYANECGQDEEKSFEYRMMNACMLGHTEVVEEYLEEHNANDFLHTGWTPILYAASSAQAEIIEQLLLKGADPNIHNDGYTPLMALCNSTCGSAEKRLKCLSLLVEARVNVDVTSKQRETALMFACKLQKPEFVRELLKHVKNINTCDGTRRTALIYAVAANRPDIAEILLENSADVTLTDNNNLTAKDIAYQKSYSKILSLLKCDERETTYFCEVSHIVEWRDMFPALTTRRKDTIDFDVSAMLYGMGLEKYSRFFCGMDLKTFLQLSEEDLPGLGVDLQAHRTQYTHNLHKFHRKKWNVQSMGVINKSLPYTLYDGVVTLGTITKQIGIIGSSFQYMKNILIKAEDENITLIKEQRTTYAREIAKTRKTLNILKKELLRLRSLAKKINKENNIGIPPIYIGPKENKTIWPIICAVTVIFGITLWRTAYTQSS